MSAEGRFALGGLGFAMVLYAMNYFQLAEVGISPAAVVAWDVGVVGTIILIWSLVNYIEGPRPKP